MRPARSAGRHRSDNRRAAKAGRSLRLAAAANNRDGSGTAHEPLRIGLQPPAAGLGVPDTGRRNPVSPLFRSDLGPFID